MKIQEIKKNHKKYKIYSEKRELGPELKWRKKDLSRNTYFIIMGRKSSCKRKSRFVGGKIREFQISGVYFLSGLRWRSTSMESGTVI